MKKKHISQFIAPYIGRLVFLFFLIILFSQCSILKEIKQLSQIQKSEYILSLDSLNAKLEHLETMPVIHLYGSPEEMGRQYGSILKPQLKSLFSILNSVFTKKKLEEYFRLAKETEPALPDDIKTEIKAISEVAGINYLWLVAMNVGTKVECSTLAAWGESTADRELIMGRNAEFRTKGLNNALGLIVVRHPGKGYATISITYIGMVGGFSGMNEKGVCYGNMLSYNGLDLTVNTSGLPIQVLLRLGGEKASSPEEFKEYLFNNQQMIPNIVMIADKNKAIITEHSQFESDYREGYKGVLASTNFFHSNKLLKSLNSDERYSIIMREARKYYGQLDVEKVELIMHKASQLKKNVQCVIFEPSKMKMYVSINKTPASKGPFTIVDAARLFSE